MGNLALAGSTSGTITLAPTAIAGSNTITLPAATGTVALTASPTFTGTMTATTVTSPSATALTIQSANTTAMTIDTSQNVLVGTTSNSLASRAVFSGTSTSSNGAQSVAEFQGGGSGANGGQIRLYNTYSGATNPNKYLRVDNSGILSVINSVYTVVILSLDDSGNLTINGATATKASGTTWANPSDIRLKDNVEDYAKGLPELLQVRVRSWTYNGKGGSTAGLKSVGVVADEVMTVLPETVQDYQAKLNPDDQIKTAIKQFDASEMVWLLVKSVQELSAKNDALTARIAALEAK